MMSSSQPNPGAMQVPMYAPATQGKSEEVDLGDIFSDYFMHEFDDPVVNPYSAMLAAAAAQGQQGATGFPTPQFMLPTGHGIMTPFHLGAMPTVSAAAAHNFAIASQQQQQHSFPQDASFLAQYAHIAKKHKGGITLSAPPQSLAVAPNIFSAQQTDSMAAAPAQTAAASIASAASGCSDLSSRLGISVGVQGQLNMPHRGDSTLQPQPVATDGNALGQPSSGITLPVGYGIRLGTVAGAAPVAVPTSVPLSHTQWEKQVGLTHIQHGQGGQQFDMSQQNTGFSHEVVEERRQRNREHAKRSRVRKKFLLEALQEEVKELQKENQRLRMCVQESMPEKSQKIIAECCVGSSIFQDEIPDAVKGGNGKEIVPLSQSDHTLVKSLTRGQQNFVLSDPRLPDNPIVFASQGFLDLTGYSREEVLGRNCRFLQGPGTDFRAVEIVRKAVASGGETSVLLLNYKADGTPFWNQFFLAPLRDADGVIVNFIGVQCLVEPDSGSSMLEEKVNALWPLKTKGDEDSDDDK